MKNSTAVAEVQAKVSLVGRIAAQYGVDPDKMLATLKATAFKQENNAEITNEQMMALLTVADKYQLDPFTRQIYAFPNKGGIVPIVGYDGWVAMVNRHPDYNGIKWDWSVDGQVTCMMFHKRRAFPIEITEFLSECRRDTQPWRQMPNRMLRNKAYIQCARMAFGIAGIYDEDEAARIIEKDITPTDDALRVAETNRLLQSKPVAQAVEVEVTAPIEPEVENDQA